jgi:hypothetical protein
VDVRGSTLEKPQTLTPPQILKNLTTEGSGKNRKFPLENSVMWKGPDSPNATR